MALQITQTSYPKGFTITGANESVLVALNDSGDVRFFADNALRLSGDKIIIESRSAPFKVRAAIDAALRTLSAPSTPATKAVSRGGKRRQLVPASTVASQMGDDFDGFGKTFRIGHDDACSFGLGPEWDGAAVKYAYFV